MPLPRRELRFLTCGSVDDGKSTLIGRLLFDSSLILDDQLATLARESRVHGTTGDMDYALLVDGLEAEREQGITIDVAYRMFATKQRRFLVADTPGHEQYTRNMATGASNAELAVLLVDIRAGLLTQTRRHAFIARLMGIRHIVLAANKMDLVAFDQARFAALCGAFEAAAAQIGGFASIQAIPLSARFGDNVASRSERMPWYDGPALLGYLETIEPARGGTRPFRMPVQWVNRPDASFRGYAGTLADGVIRPGERVRIGASGRSVIVDRIVTMGGDLAEAGPGDSVTLVLAEQTDVARGDVLCADDDPVEEADQFHAHLIWVDQAPLLPGRTYLFKFGTRTVSGSVTRVRHRIDVNTHEKLSAETLDMNDVGVVNVELSTAVAFEPYAESRSLGGFIVIDRLTNATSGVGMIDFALRRSGNLTWQELDITRAARARLKGQEPTVIWMTGLSGAGKSTIANLVERRLHALGRHTYILDGDNVRHGLNRDLGFTEADRVENIRRVSEVAALLVDAGLIVIVSFISPYRSDRQAARERVGADAFLEVFVDTPLAECRRRDPKGLYRKADQGLLRNLTGVDAPYEPPLTPDVHLRTENAPAADLAEQVYSELRQRGRIG